MSRSVSREKEGMALVRTLKDEGRFYEAEVLARIIRSLSSSRTTLEELHKDNMELKRQLEQKG